MPQLSGKWMIGAVLFVLAALKVLGMIGYGLARMVTGL